MDMDSVQIHPTAIVERGAELDSGVFVGPFCIVGSHVKLGKGTKLQSHCVVVGHTSLAENNEVFPFASVGNVPQDLKYKGEPTTLIIGSGNKIRESATLQPGTVQALGTTQIGDNNLFMAYSHIAHDCIVGNGNIFANSVALSGHVTVGNFATIGGIVGVHQFVKIGDYSMTAAGAVVVQDLPPYCMAQGDRAQLRGLNLIGLKRRGFSTETISKIKKAYKLVFLSGAPTLNAGLDACYAENLNSDVAVDFLLKFLQESERGTMRPPSQAQSAGLDEK
jgi:UDP-N-acetylglucosamine acyltransferase